MSVAALVLGILSLVLSIVAFDILLGYLAIPALIMGIVGIVLAAISMSKNHKGTSGLVLSIISTVFSFIPAIIWIIAIVSVVR
ncbi:MAG: hypothetical protein LKK13_01220 [Bacilli bacterium]|jgi:hypothetical protein|nr:hypothetical protein [Bacilli bacterium]